MNIEHIWEEFYNPLKGFIAKRVNNPADVDDIVQNVFIKIDAHISGLKDSQKVRPWIYQITRHTIIDYYRKQKPTVELPENLQIYDKEEEQDLSHELTSCFKSMIEQLPDIYREAIKLTELEGMTQKQLSTQLNMSFSGAKSRVQRGRQKLKELLTACCHIEADCYGNIIDYQKVDHSKDNCGSEKSCECH
ncbi:RNA polymerase sigma factor SigZ [Gracilibacillus kekensis]|uniref:RNA polymerase sigma factor SigZ n=1 Tax=Gracilibacillus kekensis TaxID=1027249 RepID=A0A1M7LBB3_9BACI|nr:RNA polymerase sigma factor SigZ [Gracilibacillus kekensis]SHM75133.1 RNA polymerase, sigma subunit, SigZ [Gracilibacillus kekensis]